MAVDNDLIRKGSSGQILSDETFRSYNAEAVQRVLVLFENPYKFYEGTVQSYNMASREVTVNFTDGDIINVSLNDSGIILLSGDKSPFCSTCALEIEVGADLICISCLACYHFRCYIAHPITKRSSNSSGWKCQGCGGYPRLKNRILSEVELSKTFCALCGLKPEANHVDGKVGIDQCDLCNSVHCWRCTSRFQGMKGHYRCVDCIGGITLYHSTYNIEFSAFADRVSKNLRALETCKGVNYSDVQPLFDEFAETMMYLHSNWSQTFSTHLELLVQLVSWQLDRGHVAALTPFHMLCLMGLHPLLNSELLTKVSQAHVESVIKKVGKFRTLPTVEPHVAGNKIPVGFLTADASNHPSQDLVKSVFVNMNLNEFEVHIFSITERNAFFDEDMKELVETGKIQVYHVKSKSDREVAVLIRMKRIFVLFDINVFTHGAREGIVLRRPATFQYAYTGYPAKPNAPQLYDGFVCDEYTVSSREVENSAESRLLLSLYVPNSHRMRYSKPPYQFANPQFALKQNKLPLNCKYIICNFSILGKIPEYVMKAWLEVVESIPGSIIWLLAEPKHARKSMEAWLTGQGTGTDGRLYLECFFFGEMISKDSHMMRAKVATIASSDGPYGAHTVAADSFFSGHPVVSGFTPDDHVNNSRWARNVSASISAALFGKDNIFMASSTRQHINILKYFGSHPEQLEPFKARLQQATEKGLGPFGELHTRELENCIKKLWNAHVDGHDLNSFLIDGRLPQHDYRDSLPVPDLGMSRKESDALGLVEQYAISLASQWKPGADSVWFIDTARIVYEITKSVRNPRACFVDISGQDVFAAEIASRMDVEQCFIFWELSELANYINVVKPRLKSTGVAFLDYTEKPAILWPPNTQIVLASVFVTNRENSVNLLRELASHVRLPTTNVEVCGVIHDFSISADDLLAIFNVYEDSWTLSTSFPVSKQAGSAKLQVQIFKLHKPRHRDVPCRRTIALQSDILLGILDSQTKLGAALLNEVMSSGLSTKQGKTLTVAHWNRVSKLVIQSSSDIMIIKVIGEGGNGIVFSTRVSNQEAALKLEVCRRAHYWNLPLWRSSHCLIEMRNTKGFPRLVNCFQGHTKASNAFVYLQATDEFYVCALSTQRLNETIENTLRAACSAFQNCDPEGVERFRTFSRQLLSLLFVMTKKRRLIHRDIKPANLMWSDDRVLHFVDLGQAQFLRYEYVSCSDIPTNRKIKGLAMCSSAFPVGCHSKKEIRAGTPGYFLDTGSGETPIPEREMCFRDMYAAGMTLMHAIIPSEILTGSSSHVALNFSERWGIESKSCPSFVKFLCIVRLLIPQGNENQYIDWKPCERLLRLIFMLITPGSTYQDALHSPFILDPLYSLQEEEDLRNGVVVRGTIHNTDRMLKPVVLMLVEGYGLVVFRICWYHVNEVIGYYGGKCILRITDGPECFSNHALSTHQNEMLIGDVTEEIPVSTYVRNRAVMSFAQSSRETIECSKPGNMHLVHYFQNQVHKITLDNGCVFGFIEMTARTTGEGEGVCLATWDYDWGASSGFRVYSPEEEVTRQQAAAKPMDDKVMARVNDLARAHGNIFERS